MKYSINGIEATNWELWTDYTHLRGNQASQINVRKIDVLSNRTYHPSVAGLYWTGTLRCPSTVDLGAFKLKSERLEHLLE